MQKQIFLRDDKTNPQGTLEVKNILDRNRKIFDEDDTCVAQNSLEIKQLSAYRQDGDEVQPFS